MDGFTVKSTGSPVTGEYSYQVVLGRQAENHIEVLHLQGFTGSDRAAALAFVLSRGLEATAHLTKRQP